jgi:upstream activation factor subunit UAF30
MATAAKNSKTASKSKALAKKSAPATKAKAPKAAAGGFMKAMEVSAELGAVIGTKAVPRTEVTKKLWAYIKKENLQDPKNKREINADDKLKAVFGKSRVNMFEMTKLVGKHLK